MRISAAVIVAFVATFAACTNGFEAASAVTCGDGVCGLGETSSSCASDCVGSMNGTDDVTDDAPDAAPDEQDPAATCSTGPFPLPTPGGSSIGGELARGPYVQMGGPTSVVIRWRTTTPRESVVRYGTSLSALTEEVRSATPTTEHEVTLDGLSLCTQYFYQVESEVSPLAPAGEDLFFVTFPKPGVAKPAGQKTRVWVLGDSGTANSDARAVRDAYYAFTGTTHTDLWLMLGDNAYSDGREDEYQEAVFETYPTMLKRSALFPAAGNHERDAVPMLEAFTLPAAGELGGVPSQSELNFSFDFGNIHFVVLDSYTDDGRPGPDLLWLENDLEATTRDWVIVYFHHPPYSRGSHGDNSRMRDDVVPLLHKYGVDLVLGGHSHSYERSYLLDFDAKRSDCYEGSHCILDARSGIGDSAYEKADIGAAPHQGSVFVVAGSSGKVSGGDLNHPLMFTGLDELGSVVLDFSVDAGRQRLDLLFVRETGDIDDTFTMFKGP